MKNLILKNFLKNNVSPIISFFNRFIPKSDKK